jgi:hypothetical protein
MTSNQRNTINSQPQEGRPSMKLNWLLYSNKDFIYFLLVSIYSENKIK